MKVVVYEDSLFRQFYPLTLTRPVFNLKTGIFSFAERWKRQFPGNEWIYYVREDLAELVKRKYPDVSVNPEDTPDGALWLNGRCLNSAGILLNNISTNTVWKSGDTVCAALLERELAERWLASGFTDAEIFRRCPVQEFSGKVFSHTWELIENNRQQIASDALFFNGHWGTINERNLIVENRDQVYAHPDAVIRIGAVLETENGPIIIDEGARIEAGAVIKGPVYIGRHSLVTSLAVIREGVTLGPWSKIGGEVSMTIFQGYTNKPHAGFLGNAYLGAWCNLGAGTDTSNLKNNYSTVRAWCDGSNIDTGLQFLGLTMGDHSKAAIGTTFNTGTVIGVGTNIFHSGFPPKYVPSFIWGGNKGSQEHSLSAMIETGKRVMGRRNMEMSLIYQQLLGRIFEENREEREQFLG